MIRYLLAALPMTAVLLATPRADAGCCHYHHRHRYVYYYYPASPPPNRTVDPPRWSLGAHLTGLSTNHSIGDEGVVLGGLGAHLRVRGYRWGAELAVSVVGNEFADGGLTRTSVPVQASALLYLLPRGRFNLFLLGGLRVVPSHVRWELPNLQDDQTFVEVGMQGGVGAELLLGRWISLTGDLRAFGTVRANNEPAGVYYEGIDDEAVIPEKTAGLQLTLGASIRF